MLGIIQGLCMLSCFSLVQDVSCLYLFAFIPMIPVPQPVLEQLLPALVTLVPL